jgi:hypothetical protein
MRKLTLLLLMGIALPAFSAKRVTVDQLNALLNASHRKADARLAEQLSGLELTERASSAKLAQWETEFPGHRTRDALMALADSSAFLQLSEAEIPKIPAPPLAEQQRILSLAAVYVSKIIPQLPNFLATRNTTYFEDSPSQQVYYPDISSGVFGVTEYRPLHVVGKSSTAVTYLDGREVADSGIAKGHPSGPRSDRLTTTGEFGPILAVVVGDALHGSVNWSHWEQGIAGPEAVLHYAVPRERSHYKLVSACQAGIEQEFPAYHGEIAVDPASGSVLRLMLVADMDPTCLVAKANIVVEYGSVAIGGRSYICPVKSVSLTRMPVFETPKGVQAPTAPLKTRLNDVSFDGYHLFRAESRILSGDNVKPPESNP